VSATFALLTGVTASATGSAFELPVVGREVGFVVALSGPGGIGTVALEGSLDGTLWFTLASVSIPEYVTFEGPVRLIRASYDDGGHTGSITVQALQSDEDG